MLNKTKDTLDIPEVMTNVNIVMIPKAGTPSLHDIQKQRGIFLLSVFCTIIMKLLLQDEYEKVDTFMSDANAGERKGKRVQDHLFIINGIVVKHARQISIGIYDCEQCFDSLWQEEVINNLYDAGVKKLQIGPSAKTKPEESSCSKNTFRKITKKRSEQYHLPRRPFRAYRMQFASGQDRERKLE